MTRDEIAARLTDAESVKLLLADLRRRADALPAVFAYDRALLLRAADTVDALAAPVPAHPAEDTPVALCPHGETVGACSWCDLRDDGGLPELKPMPWDDLASQKSRRHP